MADCINGKDGLGLDPNSALEGLIFQSIALLDIHASRVSSLISNKVKSSFSELFTFSKEKKFLYQQVAIPSAKEEIRKWDKV